MKMLQKYNSKLQYKLKIEFAKVMEISNMSGWEQHATSLARLPLDYRIRRPQFQPPQRYHLPRRWDPGRGSENNGTENVTMVTLQRYHFRKLPFNNQLQMIYITPHWLLNVQQEHVNIFIGQTFLMHQHRSKDTNIN